MGWRNAMFTRLLITSVIATWTHSLIAHEPGRYRRMCVVLGAPGEESYAEPFRKAGSRWRDAATDFEFQMIDGTIDADPESTPSHREAILDWIAYPQRTPLPLASKPADEALEPTEIAVQPDGESEQQQEHWLVFIGHGTHDAKTTRFNLHGKDLTADELGVELRGKPGKWVIIVCASSSAPFLAAVAGPDRVVITATKSGSEENYSRFGEFLSQSLGDHQSDLDHDRELSVLELFLAASRRVEKYYADGGWLATEQALIDDNGDGRGTPAAFYRGVRAVKAPAEGTEVDGLLARRLVLSPHGRRQSLGNEKGIEEIERAIDSLRRGKDDWDSDVYYGELEKLLLQLASYLRAASSP